MSLRVLARSGGRSPSVYEAVIAENVESDGSLASVIVPGLSGHQIHIGVPWTSLGMDGLLSNYPLEGDRCCIVLAETEEEGEPEMWIVAWWPGSLNEQ